MRGKLTKKVVEAALPEAKPYILWDAGDTSLKGFGVLVHPTGKKSFVAQFRVQGKSRRTTIGRYGTWTAEQARDEARKLISEADRGIDRIADAKTQKAEVEAAIAEAQKVARLSRTLRFERIAVRFLREHVRLKRKKATDEFYRHVIAGYLLPAFRRRDIREISKQEVARLHGSLASKPATANRVISVLSAMYGWAEAMEILPEGIRKPTYRIEKYRETAKERFLSAAELQRLGAAIREAETVGVPWEPKSSGKTKHAPRAENRFTKIDTGAAAALRLLIFTGARLREILHLEWQLVDLDRGLLRLRDSKTGPKTILLNPPARAVLAGLENLGPFVFPGESREGKQQPRTDLKRPWRLVTKAAGLEGVRIHDLRHSFASIGAGDGHGLLIVGKLLGHTQASTTERYAHLDADPLRKASDAIAGRIASAMGEAPAEAKADVIPLKREA